MAQEPVHKWDVGKVSEWLSEKGFSKYTFKFNQQKIDGKALLLINETDLKTPPLSIDILGDVKRLCLEIRQLKLDSQQILIDHGYDPHTLLYFSKGFTSFMPSGYSGSGRYEDSESLRYLSRNGLDGDLYNNRMSNNSSYWRRRRSQDQMVSLRYTALDGMENEYLPPQSSRSSEDGHATFLQPEVWKALIALTYCFVVTWITAFVMVIVHDRVPDMKKYPPLPDIFLDNVPHIPWAFHMCEWTGTVLLLIWLSVLLVHKHRFILLRRFFALSGTVFLLRCITMLITSLSVPGTHLECNPRPTTGDGEFDIFQKMRAAYRIWKGAGMSIQGVRTCGDYMFSGHTVALTMLNFFITEYSPRDVYLLHTFSWLLNMFGIFFILSGHEHYSIDVFIAFYISSRLFLYYHTLANNQSLMQRDQGRTRIWFPLFSFFESDVDGIVPNEYESPLLLLQNLASVVKETVKRISFLFVANLTTRPSSHPTRKHKRKTQ